MINQKFTLCAFADEASNQLDGQIRALHENAINLLEIRGVDGKNIAELNDSEAREAADKLKAAGTGVWAIGSPCGKSEIAEPFMPELDKFKRVLDTAHIMDAKNIRIFSFYGTDGKPEFRDEVLLRLSRFTEAAAGSGVTLCHENERGIYGDIAVRCAEIHKAIPEIRAVFDPANFILCGQDTTVAWDILGDFVAYMHIKDAKELSGGWKVVPPGEGDGRIADLVKSFAAASPDRKVLSIEPHLSVFGGLEKLERHKTSVVGSKIFANKREAFDYAVAALRKIIE